jgi:hypothetical protein
MMRVYGVAATRGSELFLVGLRIGERNALALADGEEIVMHRVS